jgi:hypothetical protein
MNRLQTFDRWHETVSGRMALGLIALAVAYVIGSRAIDTGSWWEYLFAFGFLVGGLQHFVKVIGRHKTAKAH